MGHHAIVPPKGQALQPEERNGSAAVRTLKDTAWAWQDKRALRKIREAFDQAKTVESALAVYLAVTEIASDKECETLTSTHAFISQRSGCSPRTVASRLKELSEIGLIQISTPQFRAPSTFTLLAIPVSQPLQNDIQAHSHVLQRDKKAPLQALEVSFRNPSQKKWRTDTGVAGGVSLSKGIENSKNRPLTIEHLMDFAQANTAGRDDWYEAAERFWDFNEKKSWRIKGKPIHDWQAAWFKFFAKWPESPA